MAFCVDPDLESVVKEIVPDVDYPETPSLTIRVFLLGFIFCVVLSFANTIFSFRTNTFTLTPYVAILLAYPIGKFLEHTVPNYFWYTRWFKVSLNPGPFTVKEHVLIGIWATTGAGGAYGTSNIVVQRVFYKMQLPPHYCIAFLISLNLIGFGFSGLFRRWVIRPVEMAWPSVLPFVSLYSAFHGGLRRGESDTDSVIDPKHNSKLRYFFIAVAACFAYHMVGPSFMSAGVASIPLLCLVVPKSSTFWRTIVGSQFTGVGAFAISLDWSLIGSLSMVTPFWASLSATVGSVALQWIATPLGIYQNWFNAPPRVLSVANSLNIFTNRGKIIDSEVNFIAHDMDYGTVVNWDNYEKFRPLHLTPLFALHYFSSMAQFMSAFVHCIVWYGHDIWRRFRGVDERKNSSDIFCRYIDHYPEVPQWMYLALLTLTSAMAVFVCQHTEMDMPWYMTLLAIGFASFACFPIAIVLATTGVQLYLNVASEFLVGLLMPGFPIIHMAFKSLAVSVGQQCMTLLADLKLGHYMKIPPRHVFITQVSASIVSAVASYGATYLWLLTDQHANWIAYYGDKYIQFEAGADLWASTSNRTFYSASLIWGLIGPRRFFFESPYGPVIIWGLVVGASVPIVIKMLDMVSGKRIPWKYVQGPLLFTAVTPGRDMSYVFSQFLVALFFQFFMYRYRTNWWKRHNYILACALDVGVAIATVVVAYGFHHWGIYFPEWELNPGKRMQYKLDLCRVTEEPRKSSSRQFDPVSYWG
ncbi:OPT oligopeptide transporter protein-domain-containing protein [Catenaria anguillulae PL171]|uniref:OPT oligopeptide transporter protein-domain-containing protein n=1 Tax=Catenaria anguillulae PL171 TaxID=765915 RepID=A0A1Y2H7K8_9FUNG|nr:OPT oligopeptide transporter protein-domain-containing protein [Catenaria anguillulae PL171]